MIRTFAASLTLLSAIFMVSVAQAEGPASGEASSMSSSSLYGGGSVLDVRDPFKRPVILLERQEPRSELETIGLDQFQIMGVATGPDRIKAMLKGPDGKMYYVTEKTKIGLRQGVVTRITPDTMHVREKIINVLGQEEDVFTEIKLPPVTKAGGGGT